MTPPNAITAALILPAILLAILALASCSPPRKCLVSHHEMQYPYLAYAGSDNVVMRTMALIPQDTEVCDKYEDAQK